MDDLDMTTMPDAELAALAATATAEQARRQALAGAARRVDDMCLEHLRAEGRVNGAEWQPPAGFVGAYPQGWRVTHDGGTFEAAAPGAVTAPPSSDWDPVDPDTPLIDFWEPRHYGAGEQARDAGLVFTAASAVEGQRPFEYPGGWTT